MSTPVAVVLISIAFLWAASIVAVVTMFIKAEREAAVFHSEERKRLQAEAITLARRENWTPVVPQEGGPRPVPPVSDAAELAKVGRVLHTSPTKPATTVAFGKPEQFPTS